MLVRKILLLAVAVTLGACASSARIQRSADRHEARAKELEAAGDTVGASQERVSAAKQTSKANTRKGFEDAMPVVFH